MARGMTRIEPFHGPVVPESGWERAGTTPEGRQVYIERTPRTRAVPDYEDAVCDMCDGAKQRKNVECPKCDGSGMIAGKRRYAKNPQTGEPLYPRNKAQHYIHERMFYLDSDGQGNQIKIDWAPPTPEQIAAQERAKQVAGMIPRLAEALVTSGLDADDIVQRLTAPAPQPRTRKPKDESPDADTTEL